MTYVILSALLMAYTMPALSQGYLPPRDYSEYFKRPIMPNPIYNTPTPEKISLGRDLFFDSILSKGNTMSCATCHDPGKGWTDGLALAVGRNGSSLRRRTPTLINIGFEELLFWDGRIRKLEEQVFVPIQNPEEMAEDPQQLIKKLKNHKNYATRFLRIYPKDGVTLRGIAEVIASFERTIVSDPTPFDKFINGDTQAISGAARKGLEIFNAKGRCIVCHSGWRFSDGNLHDTGLKTTDLGGYNFFGMEKFKYSFKTPTLRLIARRGPYMHDGSLTTITDVVEFYDRGGDAKRQSLSPHIRALHLSPSEKRELIEFLKTL